MKQVKINFDQSFERNGSQVVNSVELIVNVLDNGETFSAKVLRKLLQRSINNSLEIEGIGFSKGNRFKLRAEFEGLVLSQYETFYNSSQRIQANFNRKLRQRLNALVIDIKDIIEGAKVVKKETAKVETA